MENTSTTQSKTITVTVPSPRNGLRKVRSGLSRATHEVKDFGSVAGHAVVGPFKNHVEERWTAASEVIRTKGTAQQKKSLTALKAQMAATKANVEDETLSVRQGRKVQEHIVKVATDLANLIEANENDGSDDAA